MGSFPGSGEAIVAAVAKATSQQRRRSSAGDDAAATSAVQWEYDDARLGFPYDVALSRYMTSLSKLE